MSSDDVSSTRRTVLKTVGGTAVGLTVTVGAASADHEHPDVETHSATDVGQTEATLHGEVTAFGDGADWVSVWFQYGLESTSGWSNVSGSQILLGSGSFSETITGLSTDTRYKFRAVAQDEDDRDRGYGDTRAFSTGFGDPVK